MLVSLFAVSLSLLAATGDALKWKQCGNKNTVSIKNFDFEPLPMKVPGETKMTLVMDILKPLNGSNVVMTIKRNSWLGWITIPCIFEVGSCTYKDTCTLLHRIMSENWGGFTGPIITELMGHFNKLGVNLECPAPVQTINLVKASLKLPKPPVYMAFLTAGEYNMRMETKDKRDGKSVLCLEWDLTIVTN